MWCREINKGYCAVKKGVKCSIKAHTEGLKSYTKSCTFYANET